MQLFNYSDVIELKILALNLAIIVFTYVFYYPKYAGNNFNRIAAYDLLASSLALAIVGWHYWGSGQEFSFVLVEANWFWFTLISYSLIEIPIMLWYFKKYQVKA